MSFPRKYCKANIDRLFIAYSYVYLEKALQVLAEHKGAKAVVLQPFQQAKSFSSTDAAMCLYKEMKGDLGIPILFTPQARTNKNGQFFTYGSRLLRLLNIIDNEDDNVEFNRQRQDKNWVLQKENQDENDVYATKNLLVVQAPIQKLERELPVDISTNILSNKGTAVGAVSIPAPKLIALEYRDFLNL
jgi:hypothetical protein